MVNELKILKKKPNGFKRRIQISLPGPSRESGNSGPYILPSRGCVGRYKRYLIASFPSKNQYISCGTCMLLFAVCDLDYLENCWLQIWLFPQLARSKHAHTHTQSHDFQSSDGTLLCTARHPDLLAEIARKPWKTCTTVLKSPGFLCSCDYR